MKAMLSVALAVFNEEESLSACLSSVQDLADEIVIVDGGSTDRTLEIARSFGAKILQTDNPPMFHINKQKALDACSHDWILQLDADERVSVQLVESIRAVIQNKPLTRLSKKQLKLFSRHQAYLQHISIVEAQQQILAPQAEIAGYFLPRLNYFLGGTLRHGGVYPDGVIRLVKKGKARFPCVSVHEQIEIDGKVSWLPDHLDHHGDPSFSRYLLRANRYTSLTASDMLKNDVQISPSNLVWFSFLKPIQITISLLIRHKGILDGFPGAVFALFSGLHYALAYFKLIELRLKIKNGDANGDAGDTKSQDATKRDEHK